MPEIALKGCTPEPLMNYLKALGVLRLVSEQKDKNAKGCWRNGVFWLKSELDEDGLVRFFLDEYKPTPVFAPWNGDGGFLTDTGTSLNRINQLRATSLPRLNDLKNAVTEIDSVEILKDFKTVRGVEKTLRKQKENAKKRRIPFPEGDAAKLKHASQQVTIIKDTILSKVRGTFPDSVIRWLDACMVINAEGFSSAPLLGSGGCDGKLEFSTNYIGNLLLFFDLNEKERRDWIKQAILTHGQGRLVSTSIGQFSPGQMGGPNATQGMEGESLINPFNYLLMVEGVLLFASSVTRKYNCGNAAKSVSPFTVYASSVGVGFGADKDTKEARGEMWLPVWPRFSGLPEISQLLAEGRAEIFKTQATSGIEMSRAISSLGIDRGITGFYRYGFLKRSGKAYLATSLGHFDVRPRPDVDLIREVDRWLEQFRRAVSDDNAPPRFKTALRRIERAIFDFCQFGGTTRFCDILCALGQAERELAITSGKVGHNSTVRPLSGISPQWLNAANDESVEFGLALALASVWNPERKVGPLRSNLESITWFKHPDWKGYTAWATRQKSVVWTSADLVANLVELLERRMLDGSRSNCEKAPLAGRHKVSLNAISAFIAGEVDDARIEELLWGMVLIDHTKSCQKLQHTESEAPPIPRAYALLKLLFLPDELETKTGKVRIKPEARILSLLRAGRADEACIIAARRLRISKVIPMPHGRITHRDGDWDEATECIDQRRLAAALLFPINKDSVEYLKLQVIRPEKDMEGATR